MALKYSVHVEFCPGGCHPVLLLENDRTIAIATPRNPLEVMETFTHWYLSTHMTWEEFKSLCAQTCEAVVRFNARLSRPKVRVVVYEIAGFVRVTRMQIDDE